MMSCITGSLRRSNAAKTDEHEIAGDRALSVHVSARHSDFTCVSAPPWQFVFNDDNKLFCASHSSHCITKDRTCAISCFPAGGCEELRQAVCGMYGTTLVTIGQRGNRSIIVRGKIAAGSRSSVLNLKHSTANCLNSKTMPCQNCTFMEIGRSRA